MTRARKCLDGPCPSDLAECKGAGWGCYSHTYERKREATARKAHRCGYGYTIEAGTRYAAETRFFVPWAEGGKTVAVDMGKKCAGVKCGDCPQMRAAPTRTSARRNRARRAARAPKSASEN